MKNRISVDYTGAIQHYQNLKQEFLSYYKQIRQIDSQDIEKDFITKMTEELNSESIEEEYKKASSLLGDLQQIVTNKEYLKSLRQQAKSLSESGKLSGDQILEEITNQIVASEEYQNIVQASIVQYGQGFQSKDILSRARGYTKAMVKMRIINRGSHNPAIYSRAQKMKGYYREGLMYKSLNKIFEHLEINPPVTIKAMGAENTEIDTLIQFHPSALNIEVSEKIGSNFSFGLQSKSYIDPWIEKGMYQSMSDKAAVLYSIGSRAELLAGLANKKSWIAGVNYLGQTNNIKAALGERNALYVTGSNFYFTADLISNMRRNAYYIAFVFSVNPVYEATKQVTWQRQLDHAKWVKLLKSKNK